MHYKHAAILVVIFTIATAFAWDLAVAATGQPAGDSWSDAFRSLNKSSDGLLGLMAIAVLIHLIALQWFPAAWRDW